MGTIATVTKKFIDFSTGLKPVIINTISINSNIMIELQLDQFAAGLDNQAKPLSPNYNDDPYFEEKAQAVRANNPKSKLTAKILSDNYKKWKWTIRPQAQLVHFAERSIEMPNLYINGTFWGTLNIKVTDDGWQIGATFSATAEMEAKYKTLFGLSAPSRAYLVQNILNPAINEYILNKLA